MATPSSNASSSKGAIHNMVSEHGSSGTITPHSDPLATPDFFKSMPSFGSIQSFLQVKLTTTNYIVWKLQFTPLLNCFNLQSFINVDETPGANSSSDEYLLWWRKDQLLLSWIISSLSEDILPSVVGMTSSSAIWKTLETMYGRPSESRIIQLQMQFHNLRKGDTDDIATYLRRAKLLADELKSAGASIPTRIFNATIFANLAGEYSEVVTALFVKRSPVEFDELIEVLSSHEIRLRMRLPVIIAANHPEATLPVFDFTGNKTTHGSSRELRPSGTRDFKSAHGRGGERRDPCPMCGVYGHSPYKCNYRVQPVQPTNSNSEQINRGPMMHVTTAQEPRYFPEPVCYIPDHRYAESEPTEPTWYPDSGATHHFTPSVQAITTPKAYNGSGQVQLGPGHSSGSTSRNA